MRSFIVYYTSKDGQLHEQIKTADYEIAMDTVWTIKEGEFDADYVWVEESKSRVIYEQSIS